MFSTADDEEPVMKKHKEQLAYLQSEEFQKILNAKSKHTGVLKEVILKNVFLLVQNRGVTFLDCLFGCATTFR